MCPLDEKTFKRTKVETVEKALSPSPCEKRPCDRLLPNVGVPKILLDRKFPILRCVLKSCSHPNVGYSNPVNPNRFPASLQPVLHSIQFFSPREHCTLSTLR